MAKESIVRIAEAEKAALEQEARAKAECEEIVRGAEAEAKRIAEEARARAQKAIDARVGEAKSAAAAIERSASGDAKRESEILAKNAANAHDKAVEMVIETLVS